MSTKTAKIKVRTIQNKTYDFDVDTTADISVLKKMIKEVTGYEEDCQRLICSGKIMKPGEKISDINSLVIVSYFSKSDTPKVEMKEIKESGPTGVPGGVGQTGPPGHYVYQGGFVAPPGGIRLPRFHAPEPEPEEDEDNAVDKFYENLLKREGRHDQVLDRAVIDNLIQMGFKEDAIKRALIDAGGDSQDAVSLLLSRGDEEINALVEKGKALDKVKEGDKVDKIDKVKDDKVDKEDKPKDDKVDKVKDDKVDKEDKPKDDKVDKVEIDKVDKPKDDKVDKVKVEIDKANKPKDDKVDKIKIDKVEKVIKVEKVDKTDKPISEYYLDIVNNPTVYEIFMNHFMIDYPDMRENLERDPNLIFDLLKSPEKLTIYIKETMKNHPEIETAIEKLTELEPYQKKDIEFICSMGFDKKMVVETYKKTGYRRDHTIELLLR